MKRLDNLGALVFVQFYTSCTLITLAVNYQNHEGDQDQCLLP